MRIKWIMLCAICKVIFPPVKCCSIFLLIYSQFKTNQSTILAKFKGYRDQAIKDFDNGLKDIGQKLKAVLDKAATKYELVKTKVTICVKIA